MFEEQESSTVYVEALPLEIDSLFVGITSPWLAHLTRSFKPETLFFLFYCYHACRRLPFSIFSCFADIHLLRYRSKDRQASGEAQNY